MLITLKELRDNLASTIRESQISSLLDSYINLTGLEIHRAHPWTWTRRKQTFNTVASQEDYNLDSEVDEIAVLRQISTPIRLVYVPDDLFYRYLPNPENRGSGIPRIYRRWEETGFSVNLAAADTVYVSSSSTSDGSSFIVRITGRNSSGEIITETLTLNGTTSVTSTTTFAASGLMQIAKSARTTGTITCYRTTGATVLSKLEPDMLAPRFKRIGLYPVPSSVVTMYLEYHEVYRYLVNDTDVPQMPTSWNWILREGALAKAWEYKQNEAASAQHQAIFDRGLKMMQRQDDRNPDYIPSMESRIYGHEDVQRYADSINDNYPVYGVGP